MESIHLQEQRTPEVMDPSSSGQDPSSSGQDLSSSGQDPSSSSQDPREGADVPPEGEGEGLEGPEGGFISLDKSSYRVGETAVVLWEALNIRPHHRDFIGMFEVDRDHVTADSDHATAVYSGHVSMERLLDSRLRGDTSLNGGRLQWHLADDIFPKCA